MYGEVTTLQINEPCVALKRMSVLDGKLLQADCRPRLEHARVMQQVEIDLFAPACRAYRTIRKKDYITAHDIFTIRGPDMRMKRILDHDVVLNNAKKPFAKLDATAQTDIFNNMKIG